MEPLTSRAKGQGKFKKMEGECDDLSSVSFVSSISATSSVHRPRPPDRPKPSAQRFHTKSSGKVVRSGYLATSTPYPNKRRQRRLSAGESSMGSQSRRNSSKPPKRVPHPSGSSFLQSLMMTKGFSAVLAGTTPSKRKRTHSYSSSQSVKKEKTKHEAVSNGGPMVSSSGDLDLIALRDETVRLRQLINSVMKERDLAKAVLGKTQALVTKKDKEIQDLLTAGHVPSRDATRSLVKKSGLSPGTALRVKVHALETALREREKELAAVKDDVSVTRIREMEIQTETYYREVCRLSRLLSEREDLVSSQTERGAQIKLKALNKATVKMAAQVEGMEHKNFLLTKKLKMYEADRSAGPEVISHNEQGLRGSIADKYVDHKRSQLLSSIVDLELRASETESKLKSVVSEMESSKAHYERRIGDLTGAQSDSSDRIQSLQVDTTLTSCSSLTSSSTFTNSPVTDSYSMDAGMKTQTLDFIPAPFEDWYLDDCMESQMSTVVTERDKLRNVVRKLKDDRTHYRTMAESTQESLATVQEHLESEKMNKSGVVEELEVLREKHQNEMTAIDHARKLASRKSLVFTPERVKQSTAASTLQHHWKRRQSTVKQKRFEDDREQAVLHLQSALRGHIARRQMVEGAKLGQGDELRRRSDDIELSESSGSDESDASDAVETIQSAMRGYMARQMAMKDLNRLVSRTSSPPPVVSIGDLWKDGATVSGLVGYHPPHTSHIMADSTHNRSVTKGNGLSEAVGPWRTCADMSDGDTPPLVPTPFLRLNHSLSSSTLSLVDSPGEKSLLTDEF